MLDDKVNIIAFTKGEIKIQNSKTNSVVPDLGDITINMTDSLLLGQSCLGMFDVNTEGQLVDVAIVGPFPRTFIKNLYFHHKDILTQQKQPLLMHKMVKIMGANSGLRKGTIIATSFKANIKFPEKTGQGEVFLVTTILYYWYHMFIKTPKFSEKHSQTKITLV